MAPPTPDQPTNADLRRLLAAFAHEALLVTRQATPGRHATALEFCFGRDILADILERRLDLGSIRRIHGLPVEFPEELAPHDDGITVGVRFTLNPEG